MVGRKLWLTDLTVPKFKMEAASRALKKFRGTRVYPTTPIKLQISLASVLRVSS